MLFGIKPYEIITVSMDNRIRRHHFRIKQNMRRQPPMKPAAMPVRPIHHGRNGNCKILLRRHYILMVDHDCGSNNHFRLE